MALSYPLRLACLVAVSVGLLQIVFELMIWAASPVVLRVLGAVSLRRRERALYVLQLAPVVLAVAVTTGFLVPEYVSNETNLAPEGVGWVCVLVAAGVVSWWAARVFAGLRMVVRTVAFGRACRAEAGGLAEVGQQQTQVVVVDGVTPRIALVGLMRPFIFISKALVAEGGLNPLALEVVLDHERAHAEQGDNWKLLSLQCVPRLGLRVSAGKGWMQLWQNSAEWAADEDAVGSNRARALVLAETLVALARTVARPERGVAYTNFVCDDAELASRVERLIACRPAVGAAMDGRVVAALGCVMVALVVLVGCSGLLREVPERLLHLG